MFSKLWKLLGLNINMPAERVYGLDILRAFAITVVVVTHGMAYTPRALNKVIEATYLDGVSIFFVLSGFLIGRILIKSMSKQNLDFYTLLNFWWRRWLRTIPVYFFILSAVIFFYNYGKPPGPTFKRFYIFSQNLFTPHPTYKTGKGLMFKMITYISLISYSVYLINLTPMQEYIIPFINHDLLWLVTNRDTLKTINIFLYYLLTIPLSVYSYKLIERPFMELRNKFIFSNKQS
ncbi:acyltransferase [Mucilaginibacter sp. UR6-11]|uniref:acyltransferase family protein n=1 Tax=Mucilaginibacter sp. UR6-11 TaxID=1435644 RepID=UPI001E4A7DC6|nr:acyltransferase family protein [Mucilaginibacter sp. UR6-11]MCC8425723.1 acyltransferase family protein [Mucilaginibacter sp. UR6-11]